MYICIPVYIYICIYRVVVDVQMYRCGLGSQPRPSGLPPAPLGAVPAPCPCPPFLRKKRSKGPKTKKAKKKSPPPPKIIGFLIEGFLYTCKGTRQSKKPCENRSPGRRACCRHCHGTSPRCIRAREILESFGWRMNMCCFQEVCGLGFGVQQV